MLLVPVSTEKKFFLEFKESLDNWILSFQIALLGRRFYSMTLHCRVPHGTFKGPTVFKSTLQTFNKQL